MDGIEEGMNEDASGCQGKPGEESRTAKFEFVLFLLVLEGGMGK